MKEMLNTTFMTYDRSDREHASSSWSPYIWKHGYSTKGLTIFDKNCAINKKKKRMSYWDWTEVLELPPLEEGRLRGTIIFSRGLTDVDKDQFSKSRRNVANGAQSEKLDERGVRENASKYIFNKRMLAMRNKLKEVANNRTIKKFKSLYDRNKNPPPHTQKYTHIQR